MSESIKIIGVRLPLVEGRCDLAELIIDSLNKQGLELRDNDVLAITCKIVSKCLGYLVNINNVAPSRRAMNISKKAGGDPRFIELLLRESDDILLAVPVKRLADERLIDLYSLSKNPEITREILEEYPTLFIVSRDGSYWSDAGLDSSNHPPGIYSIPPRDLDKIARSIRDRVRELTGREVAVVLCDTEIFLTGSIDLARGSYGIEPVERGFGDLDLYGKPKYGGVDAVVHEICSAAALVMRQTSQGVPVALIRGLRYDKCECGYSDRITRDPRRIPRIIRHVIRHTLRVLGLRRLLRIFLLMI